MISFIKGRLVAKEFDNVVVETAGLGYSILMSARDISRLPELGREVQVLTRLQIKDDAPILFGFLSMRSKELFEKLVSVSGVGPKVALSVLSTYDAEEVASALACQDVAAIQRVPGVGKKMASRIVLELKDAFTEADTTLFAQTTPLAPNYRDDVLDALLSMGFTSAESELALKDAPEGASDAVLLQYALKRLGE